MILLGAALAAAVAVAAWRKRPDPMAMPLAALMIASLAWAIPYAVSLEVGDPAQATVWYRLRYPGAASLPPAYLIVAIAYAGYEEWLTKRLAVGLAVVPAISVVLAWAGGTTDLFWMGATVESVGTASAVKPTFGPWYAIHSDRSMRQSCLRSLCCSEPRSRLVGFVNGAVCCFFSAGSCRSRSTLSSGVPVLKEQRNEQSE